MTSPLEPNRDLTPLPSPSTPPPPPLPAPRPRRRIALPWLIAIAADTIQWLLLPLFSPGAVSPFEVGLDLIVSLTLIRLCGWHWAFLPAAVAELVPGLDLVPTWTAAVWLATRSGREQRPSA